MIKTIHNTYPRVFYTIRWSSLKICIILYFAIKIGHITRDGVKFEILFIRRGMGYEDMK